MSIRRDIKFRGISILSNQFVYGYFFEMYHKSSDSLMLLPYIISSAPESPPTYVKRDTIGQFTGLLDKNGVEIYEGDILSIKETDFYKGGHHIVEFNVDSFISYSVLYNDINRANKYLLSYQLEYGNAQVIGNIHDNPELLT